MQALVVGDIHLADRPPSIRTDAYAEQILAKLKQTVDIAHKVDVDVVIWAGDVFHIKTPSRTSHELVQKTCDVMREYKRPLLIVPGNHDMRHDRLDTLPEQPLGVLFKAGAIPLVGDVEMATANGLVRVFGIPYLYDWKRDLPKYMSEWKASKAGLMVTHAPIVPPGETRPFEIIDASDWSTLMERHGEVYFAHMHDPDGTFVVNETKFCNQGAISRGSLHEKTVLREPSVTIYSDDPLHETFSKQVLEFLPPEDVFRLDVKNATDAKLEKLDTFLTSVQETELEGLSVEQVQAHLDTLELTSTTRGLILELLEEAMSK